MYATNVYVLCIENVDAVVDDEASCEFQNCALIWHFYAW